MIGDQNPRISRIGRPSKTQQGKQFKKEYQLNELKFEVQCELIASIHELFFAQPPKNPQNQRVNIAYITKMFEDYKSIDIYQTLLTINEFYYKNSSVFPADKLKYTSLLDISYLIHQLKAKHGEVLSNVQLVLTVIFFLYNQKLINHNSYEFFSKNFEDICYGMVNPQQAQGLHKICLLVINLILEIAVKEKIKIKAINTHRV